MIVEFEKHVDYEPLTMRFVVQSDPLNQMSEYRSTIESWFKQRDERAVCANACQTKFLLIRQTPIGFDLLIQWMCQQCIGHFLPTLSSRFPEIERASVGNAEAPGGRIPGGPQQIVRLPARMVTIEDGSMVSVAPFDICRYPISVGAFERFVRATGYVTSGESAHYSQTYRDNGTLIGIDSSNRDQFEARFLSYEDAVEFCKYSGSRLPTDVELLAAITVDDEVRTISGSQRAGRFRESPQLLRCQGISLTSTLEAGLVVTRSGPWVTKHPEWDTSEKYRRRWQTSDPVGQLYVILEEGR